MQDLQAQPQPVLLPYAKSRGNSILLGVGVMTVFTMMSVLAIDLPTYFAAQNQLQTAVNAAALAGAAQLPIGQDEAEEAAYEYASKNLVANRVLQPEDLTYTATATTFEVSASAPVPTVVSRFLCALGTSHHDNTDPDNPPDVGGSENPGGHECDSMTLHAQAKAMPAARDTILVIDASSSMDDLGNGRPLKDVKNAANQFITMVANLNSEAIDRIGLVSFNQTGKLQIGLTSQQTSAGFASVKTKVSGITLFSGTGWNTNYEVGLKTALDEMQAHGRKNARKSIIFMTDGKPNLPAPANYYSYSQSEPYRKCTDAVHNSTPVKALCYYNNKGQKVCPQLPSSQITDAMITSSFQQCGLTYVNYMTSATQTQSDRARDMGVVIHTIEINDPTQPEQSIDVLRRLIKNMSWDPQQLDYMASATHGEQYEARNYDAAKITEIYNTIAQDIKLRLAR